MLAASVVLTAAPAGVQADGPVNPDTTRVSRSIGLAPAGDRDVSGSPLERVPQGSHSIFLEFGGGTPGGKETASGCEWTQTEPFSNDTLAASVHQAVIADWSPFDIRVTNEEPASGTYTTILIGPNSCCGGGAGVAPVICGTDNLNAAVHVCSRSDFNTNILAGTASQEAAHTYGLMHVDDVGEIMNAYADGGVDDVFRDKCYPPDPNFCSGQRDQCSNGQQNSVQELLAMFGPGEPDTQPPTVSITYPSDGDVFEAGSDFEILGEASDDKSVATVELYVDGSASGTDTSSPWSWMVSNIGAGSYTIYLVATDSGGNTTQSDSITFEVQGSGGSGDGDGDGDGDGSGSGSGSGGGDGDGDGDGDGSGSGSGGGDGDGSGGGDGDGSGSGSGGGDGDWPGGSGTGGAEGDPEGCACNASGSPSWLSALFFPVLAVFARRRVTRRR